MKTTKHNLNAIAMGVALAMGSLSLPVSASEGDGFHFPHGLVPWHPVGYETFSALKTEIDLQDPTFDASERTGLALVESALSLIAAREHIDGTTCSEKDYTLAVDAGDGEGDAQIFDRVGGQVDLHASLEVATKGAQVDVEAAKGASLYGAKIKDYTGDHQWSRKNNIFLDHADWTFKHQNSQRLIKYSEHSIKDYFLDVLDSEGKPLDSVSAEHYRDLAGAWEFDAGLEVISKKGFPVTKWGELSWYRQPDGVRGVIVVTKQLVSEATCNITFVAEGGGLPFSHTGVVHVGRHGHFHETAIPAAPVADPVAQ
jgi:hypothetical protein